MGAGRVLIISENAPVPADRRVWNISRSLVGAGWEVVIVCAKGPGRDSASYEVLEGIEIHRYPLRPAESSLGYAREYLQALWRIRRLVHRLSRTRRFDIVHACNPPDVLLLAARSLQRQGTRFVFDHHDLVPELYRSRFGRGEDLGYRATFAAERLAFRLADVSLATNGSYARVATERGRMDPERVFIVRNGPDLYVYVSPDANGYADGVVELGKLKADKGNQNYDMPAGFDPVVAASVVIWCKQFSVQFAVAPLAPDF